MKQKFYYSNLHNKDNCKTIIKIKTNYKIIFSIAK